MKVWIVQRPLSKNRSKYVAAYFTRGAARNACVPNFEDRIIEGWLEIKCEKPKKGGQK